MESVVAVRECMWCHEPYYLSDGRYKYCSDECAEKARLARRKENFSKPEKIPEKSFWQSYREKYWRSRLAASKSPDNEEKRWDLREVPTWLSSILKESKQRRKKHKRRARCAKK